MSILLLLALGLGGGLTDGKEIGAFLRKVAGNIAESVGLGDVAVEIAPRSSRLVARRGSTPPPLGV